MCNLIIAVFALIVEKGGFIEIQLESYKNTQNYQEYIAKYKAITNAMDVWIGCDQSMFANILFYILPLLCVLSFALSYHYDIQSAYLEKILIRTTKKKYYVSKFIAVLVSSGVVGIQAFFFNLISTLCFFPMSTIITPEYFVTGDSVFARLFIQIQQLI